MHAWMAAVCTLLFYSARCSTLIAVCKCSASTACYRAPLCAFCCCACRIALELHCCLLLAPRRGLAPASAGSVVTPVSVWCSGDSSSECACTCSWPCRPQPVCALCVLSFFAAMIRYRWPSVCARRRDMISIDAYICRPLTSACYMYNLS
jgi:hypothetical protein